MVGFSLILCIQSKMTFIKHAPMSPVLEVMIFMFKSNEHVISTSHTKTEITKNKDVSCFVLIVLRLVTVNIVWLFLTVPWVGLQYGIS